MIKKIAIIKKLPSGQYRLYSKKKGKDGKRKNLGTFDTLEQAKKHEQEVQYFKHNSDDGQTDDKETKVLSNLSDIATYLEEAGFIGEADKVYMSMSIIEKDDDDALDSFYSNDAQRNSDGGTGIMSGNPGGGSPSLFSIDVAAKMASVADDLDEEERYNEADAIDDVLKIIQKLDKGRMVRQKERVREQKYMPQGDEAAARSNGKHNITVIDDQNAGMFQGLSDAYMYSGYGNLEGGYGGK